MNAKQPSTTHILIIDDDPIARMISTILVKKFSDAVVSACGSGRQALGLFSSWKTSDYEKIPNIILLDINMPQMSGWEFLDQFQVLPGSFAKECRVIMLSSSLDPGDIERCKMYRCVEGFVSKPMTAEKVKTLFPEMKISLPVTYQLNLITSGFDSRAV
jgi:CheY-like chemotaxis protein